jgi:hypothetical protein
MAPEYPVSKLAAQGGYRSTCPLGHIGSAQIGLAWIAGIAAGCQPQIQLQLPSASDAKSALLAVEASGAPMAVYAFTPEAGLTTPFDASGHDAITLFLYPWTLEELQLTVGLVESTGSMRPLPEPLAVYRSSIEGRDPTPWIPPGDPSLLPAIQLPALDLDACQKSEGCPVESGAVCKMTCTYCEGGSCECAYDGLEAYFPLDGDPLDRSGHQLEAQVMNAAFEATSAPLDHQALSFSAQSLVELGGTYDRAFVGSRSLCAWIQPAAMATGAGLPIIVAGSTQAADYFSVQPASSLRVKRCGPPNSLFLDDWFAPCLTSGDVVRVTPESPNFVCFAFDADMKQTRFFANGRTTTVAISLYSWPLSTMTIGSTRLMGSTTQLEFSGRIGEVSIWSVDLSLGQIRALWNGGRGCKAR